MKIICISDTHNQHHSLTDKLPDGDMIIHAGDISVNGTLEEIHDFLIWYSSLPYKYKIFVAGNHDLAFERNRKKIKIPKNVYYLENNSIVIDKLKIWGSPVCSQRNSWAFMWSLEKRKKLYESIPNDCDIIISHNPPFEILDKIKIGQNIGCPLLMTRIQEIKPELVVFGHVHEDSGNYKYIHTYYINAATSIMCYEYNNFFRS